MLHPYAWLAWLCAALAALSATRNPLYLALVLLCIAVVSAAAGSHSDGIAPPVSPLRFTLVVTVLAALFNAAMAHFGTTVLLRLPLWLPLLGGPITLEALAFGALNGLVLGGFFAAFAVFTATLPTHALIRLVPRAFFPVAVVASVALTFIPVTLRQFQQVREAQAIRGHHLRGVRDWLPLWVPLLVGGLERALQLAEAMTARGFASAGDRPQAAWTQAALVFGLVMLLAGWLLRLVWGWAILGLALLLVGVAVVAATLWVAGRRVSHSVYRPRRWVMVDSLVVGGAVIVLLAFLLPLPWFVRSSLAFYPYPTLALPSFDTSLGIATLGLLVPAGVLGMRSAGRPETEDRRPRPGNERPKTDGRSLVAGDERRRTNDG